MQLGLDEFGRWLVKIVGVSCTHPEEKNAGTNMCVRVDALAFSKVHSHFVLHAVQVQLLGVRARGGIASRRVALATWAGLSLSLQCTSNFSAFVRAAASHRVALATCYVGWPSVSRARATWRGGTVRAMLDKARVCTLRASLLHKISRACTYVQGKDKTNLYC